MESLRLHGSLVILGMVAAALAFVASDPYPGVSVDSGEYLAVADGLRQGEGLTMPYVGYDEAYRILSSDERVPMTQFPPLYPAALAVTSGAGDLSLHAAARVIGVLSFAAFMMLGAYLTWRATRSIALAALAAALLAGPDLVTIHAMAWSEQLMLLSLIGAILFSARLVERRSTADLVGLALCCIAASMARFAAVSTIAAGAVVVAITYGGTRWTSVRRGAVFAAVTIVPTVAWFVRNNLVTGVVSEKEAAWHPPSLTVLGQAAQTIGAWFVPWRVATMTVGIVVVAVVAVLAVRHRKEMSGLARASIAQLCAIFAGCYAAFLLVARTVLDQNIPFDDRILSPLLALAIVGVCTAISSRPASRFRSIALVGLTVLACVSVVRGAALSVRFSETTVAAYTSDRWRASETLAFTGRLPRSTLIITNAPDPLWFWDGRVTQILPPRSSLYSGEPNENYSAQLRDLLASTRCKRAVLVFFSQPTRKPPRRVDPVVAGDLRVTDPTTLEDGVVFEIDEPPCPG